MRKITALLLVALCATGCASTRTRANLDTVARLQPGVTTLQQAEALLGPPYSVSRTADASTLVAYDIAPASAGPWTHARTDIVVLNFNPDARYSGSTATQSTVSSELFGAR